MTPVCPVRHRHPALLVLCATLIATVPAIAAPPGYPENVYSGDAREMAMVPRYCSYTQVFRNVVPGGHNPEEIQRWTSVMGNTFIHMHHYCAGLIETNRALFISRDPQERRHYLRHAVSEFDYVIRAASPDFALLPEILTKKGENLIRLKDAQLGIVELERAINLKPDYWPPYVALSDYHTSTGNLQKAREYLERALTHSPNVNSLKKRLAELEAMSVKRKTAPQ